MSARISCCLWRFPISDRDPDCMEKFAYTDTETLLWDYSETEEHYVLVIPPARRVRTLYRVTQVYAYQWFGLNGGNNLKIIYYPFAQTHFRNLTNPCDCPPESADIFASISVDPPSVLEDSGTPMIYTVTLDIASLYDTTINFTLTGTAVEGVDYTAITHSVTITAGQTTGTFAIHPIADTSFEPDETVIATLIDGTSGPNVVAISTTNYSATGTIVNDDILPLAGWQQPLSVPLLVGYGFGRADASSYSGDWLRALSSVPPGVSGLILWIDASVFASLTLSGANITGVADQSSFGNDVAPLFINPTYQATGLNSRPTMDFNGSSAGLVKNNFAFGTGNTLTAFFVGQFTTLFSTSYGRAISYSAGPGYTGLFGSTTDQDNNFSFSLGQEGTGNNVVLYRNASIANRSFPGDGTPHRCIATIDSNGVMTVYVDGIATVGSTLNTAFASVPSQLQIGNVSSTPGNAHWHGQLSEIGVATGFSDAAAVAALDAYLKNKWGL